MSFSSRNLIQPNHVGTCRGSLNMNRLTKRWRYMSTREFSRDRSFVLLCKKDKRWLQVYQSDILFFSPARERYFPPDFLYFICGDFFEGEGRFTNYKSRNLPRTIGDTMNSAPEVEVQATKKMISQVREPGNRFLTIFSSFFIWSTPFHDFWLSLILIISRFLASSWDSM